MDKTYRLLIISILLFSVYACSLHASGKGWQAETYYVAEIKICLYEAPSIDSRIIDHLYYLNKILIIVDPASPCKLGWKLVIYPAKGYIKDDSVVNLKEANKKFGSYWYKYESNKYSWRWEIKTCKNQHSFVRESPQYQSKVSGVIGNDEKILIIINEKNDNKVWTKILYPVEGYLPAEEIEEGGGNFVLGIGGTYGVKNIPYEKNFSNLKNPYGGFLELSKTNWKLGLRIGFNYSESNIAEYYLKTQLIYAFISYNFFSLFNDHLNPYIFAGGTYWMSSFQNTKYPSLTSTYYPLEKDKGSGYTTGGGMVFSYYNFFIDAQYFLFGSRKAVFGNEPVQGEFTNQYKLYPGSNLFNIMFGYEIIF